MIMIVLLIIGLAAAAYWAYRQQSTVLISNANRILASYGIEVLNVNGLQTGLRQSRADSVEFRIDGHTAVQRINSLTLDYELQTLIRGQFSQLSAESAVLQLQQASLPDDAFVRLTDISANCVSLAICEGSATLSASIASLDSAAPALQATDIAVGGHVNFDYSAPVLRLNIEPGFDLGLAKARMFSEDAALLDIEQVSLLSSQIWRFNLNTDDQILVFNGGQLRLKAPVLRNHPDSDDVGLSGFEVDISRFNGSYDYSDADGSTSWMSRLTTQIGFEIVNVYTTLQPFNFWSYRWPVNLRWDNSQNLLIDLGAVIRGKNVANLQLNQNFSNSRGSLQFDTASLVFSPSEDSLSTLLSPLPLDADLISGALEIAANINWQMPDASTSTYTDISAWQPGGTVRIEAKELAGLIDETIFTGLNTSAGWQLQSDLSLVSTAVTLLQIQKIDPGLPLSNIQTRFHLNTGSGVLELSSLNFDMFGGKVESDPFSINLKQTDATSDFGDSFELRMDGIDISEVLGLSAYSGVSATGLVNGTLPIRLQGFKPVIEGGRLNARVPGGSIRYSSGDAATGNQSLDLVYQALEHYRYDTLSANVDYNEAGELTLEMQLQGESPELNNGQRINLNLNINDNIPALLQSLQAAQGITDRLEELLE